jgi:asparagine synthase (glutamine-hydrolysing)
VKAAGGDTLAAAVPVNGADTFTTRFGMCGIAGLVPREQMEIERLRGRVRAMTEALVHRGPDDHGEYICSSVGLGMRRLSIIDRAHGQQPMTTEDGRLVLVFNGEIYNYRDLRKNLENEGCRFRTDSDTEVVLRILERHGAEGMLDLEGMFAYALWNNHTRQLILARDWLGQKSLYWVETPEGLAFASEIKALLTLPGVARRLDVETLSHYMSLRYLPGEQTFFEGIQKLPAAHEMRIADGRRTLREVWSPSYEPKHALTEAEIVDGLDELLATVVQQHLMSEVPLGAFLSGGIDSSLVVRYASRALKEPLATFAIGVHDEGQSELPWARQVAGICATNHTETIVEPDLALLTPRMVAALDEPVDPFGAGVYVVSEVARRHVTVALGGDGGDELFAGYDRYKGQRLAEIYSSVPRALRHKLLRPLFNAIPDSFGYNSITAKLRWIDKMADSSGPERFADSLAHLRFPHSLKTELFTASRWRALEDDASERLIRRYFDDGSASAFIDQMLNVDCRTRLTENQLPTVDRMSMAHSLELRSPFLDRRVAEFAMRIPAALKLKRGRIKYVTRELAARYLPDSIVNRPKKGFGFPLALWLRGPLRELMQRTIDESRFVDAGIFRREVLQRLQDEHVAGRVDHNYRLWMIFNLEVFWRQQIDGEHAADLEGWIHESRGVRDGASSKSNSISPPSPTAIP